MNVTEESETQQPYAFRKLVFPVPYRRSRKTSRKRHSWNMGLPVMRGWDLFRNGDSLQWPSFAWRCGELKQEVALLGDGLSRNHFYVEVRVSGLFMRDELCPFLLSSGHFGGERYTSTRLRQHSKPMFSFPHRLLRNISKDKGSHALPQIASCLKIIPIQHF